MLLLSIALASAAVLLCVHGTHSRIASLVFATAVWVLLLIIGVYVVSDQLGGQGIDDAVWFHLRAGIPDAGLSEFSGLIALSAVYLAAILLMAVGIYRWSWVDPVKRRARRFGSLGALCLLLAYAFNPGVGDLFKLSSANVMARVPAVAPDSYWLPDSEQWVLNDRNVVYIYLESVERTYLDQTLFPGLTPNLMRLEQEALSFTDVMQTFGSNFTMAGIVSTLCGIPLVTSSHGNSMFGVDQFLPEAVCLSDLLNDKGYDLNFLGGASLNFAGKGNFFRTHGFRRAEGRQELRGALDDPSYMSAWGLYDDTLFEIATARFDELATGDQPFGLFMLTLDTHHPRGHVSRYCQAIEYADGADPILDAVHCADQMVADLVAHIRASEIADNTVIVINSDHLAMPNTVWDTLGQGTRRNLLMMLGPDIEPQRKHRPAVLMDVAPTLLGVLGAPIEGLGFGRNLLSERPSLAEVKDDVYDYLAGQRGFLSSLWSFPDIDSGFTIVPEEGVVRVQERTLRLPVLLTLDEQLSIDEVRFEFDSRISLVRQLSQFDYDQRFIWVDGCDQVLGWADRYAVDISDHDRLCVGLGALGIPSWDVSPVDAPLSMTFGELRNALGAINFDQEVAATRQESMRFARNYGFSPPPRYQPEPVLAGSFVLASSGGPMGQSLVDDLANPLGPMAPVELRRGLSLLGFNVGAQALLLQHFDTCTETIEALTEGRYRFQDDVERFKGQFGAFAIMAHDSAVCDGRDLSSLFADSRLTEWRSIGVRTPYIGLISGNGAVSEFVGDYEARLVIQAEDFIRPRNPRQTGSTAALQMLPFVTLGASMSALETGLNGVEPGGGWGSLIAVALTRGPDGDLQCRAETALPEVNSAANDECSVAGLSEWLQRHPGARLVATVADDAVDLLAQLALHHPDVAWRTLPRVLEVRDYFEARHLGYGDVIFDLQRHDAAMPIGALMHMDLFALAMPADWADRGWAHHAFEQLGVMTYAYSVDDVDQLQRVQRQGIHGVFTTHLQQRMPVVYTVNSVGGPEQISTITRLGDQTSWPLKRGINLVAWDQDSQPQVMAHVDTCAAEVGQQSLAAIMEHYQQHHSTWAVVAHDSAVCGDSVLAEVFADTPFEEWRQLELRQPYIAIVADDGSIHENIGPPQGAIAEQIVVWRTPN